MGLAGQLRVVQREMKEMQQSMSRQLTAIQMQLQGGERHRTHTVSAIGAGGGGGGGGADTGVAMSVSVPAVTQSEPAVASTPTRSVPPRTEVEWRRSVNMAAGGVGTSPRAVAHQTADQDAGPRVGLPSYLNADGSNRLSQSPRR